MNLADFKVYDSTEDLQEQTQACLACGSTVRPYHLFAVKGYPVLRCPSCGLGWAATPSDFDPGQIYTQGYFQGEQSDGYADYQGSRNELAAEFRRILKKIASAGQTEGRLLEIGCAYGFFLEEARQSFSVSGIELSVDAVKACQARGLDVVRQADEAFLSQRGPFDVTVMLDVIEHLMHPDLLLHDLYNHTRPGALMIITTGDFGSFHARVMGQHWRLMTPPQHLWYFTRVSISHLLARHGFRVMQIAHPPKLVPVGLITYQLARYLGLQDRISGYQLRGSVPVNLYDAMRVIARRD